ncbi:MAG: hypothetical protein IKE24_08145 [Clostridia bacterium]|nr:hypothetical protein [Clostridia bacterium]
MFGMIVGILFGLYVITAVINVVGVIIGAVFSGVGAVLSGLFSLVEGAFSGEGIALGIVLGMAWYFLRKKNTVRKESTSTIDGEEVETQVVEEPIHTNYMNGGY